MRNADIDVGQALQREAAVVCGGAAMSLQNEVQQRLSNPQKAACEFALDAGVCAGLAYTQKYARAGLLASEVLGLNAVYGMTADAQRRLPQMGTILEDTWFNRAPVEAQQRKFAIVASPMVGNLLIGTVEGSIGVAAVKGLRAYNAVDFQVPILHGGNIETVPIRRHDSWNSIYQKAQKSVAKVEVLKSNQWSTGSAFSVGADGRLATALHVVDDALDIAIRDSAGRFHSAKVVATDPAADLALLQLSSPLAKWHFKPLRLVPESLDRAERYVVSHPGGVNQSTLSVGWVDSRVEQEIVAHSSGRQTRIAEDVPKMAYELNVEPGSSGAALLNERGAVSGVCVAGSGTACAVTVESPRLSQLLEQAPRFSPQPLGNPFTGSRQRIKLDSATSEALGIQLGMVFNSKLDAIPSDFMHTRKGRVFNGSTMGDVQCAIRFHPRKKEVTVTPIALNGQPISDAAFWVGSTEAIAGSSLKIKLDGKYRPVSLESRNDSRQQLRKAIVHYNPFFF